MQKALALLEEIYRRDRDVESPRDDQLRGLRVKYVSRLFISSSTTYQIPGFEFKFAFIVVTKSGGVFLFGKRGVSNYEDLICEQIKMPVPRYLSFSVDSARENNPHYQLISLTPNGENKILLVHRGPGSKLGAKQIHATDFNKIQAFDIMPGFASEKATIFIIKTRRQLILLDAGMTRKCIFNNILYFELYSMFLGIYSQFAVVRASHGRLKIALYGHHSNWNRQTNKGIFLVSAEYCAIARVLKLTFVLQGGKDSGTRQKRYIHFETLPRQPKIRILTLEKPDSCFNIYKIKLTLTEQHQQIKKVNAKDGFICLLSGIVSNQQPRKIIRARPGQTKGTGFWRQLQGFNMLDISPTSGVTIFASWI